MINRLLILSFIMTTLGLYTSYIKCIDEEDRKHHIDMISIMLLILFFIELIINILLIPTYIL